MNITTRGRSYMLFCKEVWCSIVHLHPDSSHMPSSILYDWGKLGAVFTSLNTQNSAYLPKMIFFLCSCYFLTFKKL